MATERGLERLAELILSGAAKRIIFLTGAGVSVGAGIPDFRSPGGMYDTLRPELLTASDEDKAIMSGDPTWVVNRDLFERNAFPYLEVRRPFIIGTAVSTWKPTLTHMFMRCCHEKGLLRRVFTQNIDGLDFKTGIPSEYIVPVHGSIGLVSCELCGFEDPSNLTIQWFADEVKRNIKDIYKMDDAAPAESTPILCPKCNQPGLKPSTVMYGAPMPKAFHTAVTADTEPENVDLLVVMGTSLGVYPAASVPSLVPKSIPRVLINRDAVGFADPRFRKESDVVLLGDCDHTVAQLIVKLGWEAEFDKYADVMTPGALRHLRDVSSL